MQTHDTDTVLGLDLHDPLDTVYPQTHSNVDLSAIMSASSIICQLLRMDCRHMFGKAANDSLTLTAENRP